MSGLFNEGLAYFAKEPDKLAVFVQEGLPLAQSESRSDMILLLHRLGATKLVDLQKAQIKYNQATLCKNCKRALSANAVCEQCGCENTEQYIVTNQLPPKVSHKGNPSGITPEKQKSGYSRKPFFREHLKELSGAITREIPDDVYALVFEEAKKRHYKSLDRERVREILKRVKRPDQYSNDIAIACAFNQVPPPTFTLKQKEILEEMFEQTEEWFKRCPQSIKQRESIIGYNYLIYKFVELHEWDEFLPMIRLPKRTTVERYDEIFQWICKARTQSPRWEFTETPPQ